ncbi:J domain-containing protein [Burkholderia sp. Ac-20365]|uniref:J domain-containing protein n=1 Tax=Burkholderia sp. Ac-20365 TaxID=2703897 RepID=UPI00197BE81A|nr:J domain-containing protein [Burkholderia sp. Ac-20365]MBN3767648.1 J domain-containing protein [Burkholderia sp. Ac-20365]
MSKAAGRLVTIAPEKLQAHRSKGQRYFNSLVKQIENRRGWIAQWEAFTPVFQKRYVDEFIPLRQASMDAQVKLVHRLDALHGDKAFNAIERRLMSQLIRELTQQLIGVHADPMLKPIHDRHADTSYDTQAGFDIEHAKAMMEEMLGTEFVDGLDTDSPEAFMKHASEKFEELRAQAAAKAQAREERRARRKKTPKQLAAEARKEAAQAEISQSLRDVYRKLASALHPDREPDAEERARKTALMQRVNEAYAKRNLLQLLELQLELEHIDQKTIDGISEERLNHFNSVLKEQLGELDRELADIRGRFRGTFGFPYGPLTVPERAMEDLDAEIAHRGNMVRGIEKDLHTFDDLQQTKAWLKALKRRRSI